MKRLLFIIFVFLCSIQITFPQRVYYEKGNHYQWRSMEHGTWQFHPKWYYYRWSFRHPNYLGLHKDYVKKYGNSQPHRLKFSGELAVNNALTENQKKDMEKIQKSESIVLADREIDLVKSSVSDKYKLLTTRTTLYIEQYRKFGGSLTVLERLITEESRINDNYRTISSTHMENAKKEDSYLVVIKNAEELNLMALALSKMQYNKYTNKEMFKIINNK